MINILHTRWLVGVVGLALCWAPEISAEEMDEAQTTFRVLSWNISDDAIVDEADEFRAILNWADPDVVLLDEVSPAISPDVLHEHLTTLSGDNADWTVTTGSSGGRQRIWIAARASITAVNQLADIVAYPEDAYQRIKAGMSDSERRNPDWSMDGGIPVSGAVVTLNDRRLLIVGTDLQCCGDGPKSWQELRRRVEARTLRKLIQSTIDEQAIDGVIFGGDFNMVSSTYPLALLLGPYPAPIGGLIPAESYHADGESTWTWDGRGTPFPSNSLDYQFYSPAALEWVSGRILDAESVSPEEREAHSLNKGTSLRTGRHRPIVVEYRWHDGEATVP